MKLETYLKLIETPVDISKFDRLVEEKWLKVSNHPKFPLNIYHYSKNTQFEQYWNSETVQARGIVLNENNVVARAMPKFFNLHQLEYKVPEGPFRVFEKMDGSLILMFVYKGNLVFASKGSFESTQAEAAEKVWYDEYHRTLKNFLKEGETYLFEYVGPDNQIVLRYPKSDLVYLGTTNLEGKFIKSNLEIYGHQHLSLPEVYKFNTIKEILDAKQLDDKEGYVVRFDSGFQVKIKMELYCIHHAIMTETSTLTIWEMLMKNGKLTETILDIIPDENYDELKEVTDSLLNSYDAIHQEVLGIMRQLKGDRKTRAAWINKNVKHHLRGLVFAEMNGKDYSQSIWKLFKT